MSRMPPIITSNFSKLWNKYANSAKLGYQTKAKNQCCLTRETRLGAEQGCCQSKRKVPSLCLSHTLRPLTTQSGAHTGRMNITWGLVEKPKLRLTSAPLNLHFNKIPQRSVCTLKSEELLNGSLPVFIR